MNNFSVKKIGAETTLGEKLKKLREENLYSVKRLAKKVFIHKKYIEALEENDYANLPDEIYTKNYIIAFVKFFKRDPAPFVNEYLSEISKNKTVSKKYITGGSSRFVFPVHMTKYAIIGIIIISFATYLGFEIKTITTPPHLRIFEPADATVVKSPVLTIAGQSNKESRIKINGEPIMPNADGTFKEDIDLQRGLNIIKISASKKYSKENIIYRKIIFEESINN
jgi:transcriptional regulator with XRE-family HTH domain